MFSFKVIVVNDFEQLFTFPSKKFIAGVPIKLATKMLFGFLYTSFGFMSDGLDDMESFVDDQGDRWHTDEYGDRSYMWEYM